MRFKPEISNGSTVSSHTNYSTYQNNSKQYLIFCAVEIITIIAVPGVITTQHLHIHQMTSLTRITCKEQFPLTSIAFVTSVPLDISTVLPFLHCTYSVPKCESIQLVPHRLNCAISPSMPIKYIHDVSSIATHLPCQYYQRNMQ